MTLFRRRSRIVPFHPLSPLPVLFVLGCCLLSWNTVHAAENDIILKEGLAIRTGGRALRTPFHVDAIEHSIVLGTWTAPKPGDSLTGSDGTNRTWSATTADNEGSFRNEALRGGYVYIPYTSDRDQILLLKASGHNMVYVNQEPRTGDPYSNGSTALPILLKKGLNHLLFQVGRGALKVRLAPPPREVSIDSRDTTFPDLISGQYNETQGAVILVNATTQPVSGLTLTSDSKGGKSSSVAVPPLLPLSTRKVGFPIRHSGRSNTNHVELQLSLTHREAGKSRVVDEQSFRIRVRAADQTHRETFVSGMDGSVQYFAITPARPLKKDHPPLALVLSTHGASVEAQGQAEAYAPKTWAHVVAPTNRRPYGFDWEDWGRRDAIEVLELAQSKWGTDPQQTYLTGHSMGGHGTWQLGATWPGRFAALAPSAGWISFFSYGGGRRYEGSNALQHLIQRAANSSDTLLMKSNYLQHGIYILHGDADDNVPVSEARTMRAELEPFHRNFSWHEQPGAGHWWGNACVDWPPIFDMFARHKIPTREQVRSLHFTTTNPGISSSLHWAIIHSQIQHLAPSTVQLSWNPDTRTFSGSTHNVARLGLEVNHVRPGRPVQVTLDNQSITNLDLPAQATPLWFTRNGSQWQKDTTPSPILKGPHRSGPFKEAFAHRMLFVYATQGTPEENAWAFSKARFDAEAFWYRGNGSIDVIRDVDFDPAREADRGVILYGHAENNAAWPKLLASSPIQVKRNSVQIGGKTITGSNLACLFLRPRTDSLIASVGAVAGTGITGLKLTDRVPYFIAGVAFPDVTVFSTDSLLKNGDGIKAAGFFGSNWSIEDGEFLFQD